MSTDNRPLTRAEFRKAWDDFDKKLAEVAATGMPLDVDFLRVAVCYVAQSLAPAEAATP